MTDHVALSASRRAARRYAPLLTVLVVVYLAMILLTAIERPSAGGLDAGRHDAETPRWAWKVPTFLLKESRDGRIVFHTYNQTKILEQAAINLILGVGMTFVILTGGIDLSVGSVVALANVVFVGVLRDHPGPGGAAIAAMLGLGAGIVCGLVNGALVARARIQPFIATLGLMMIAKGAAFLIGGSQPVYRTCPSPWPTVLPIALGFVVVTAGTIALQTTVFGRHVYAVGGNSEASRIAGVRVGRVLWSCYVISGLSAGLASIVLWSRVGTGSYLHGDGLELNAIAAVVIGGTSLFGGEGSVFGTVIGALIIAVLNNGLNVASVNTTLQKIVVGAVIVFAACWDSYRRRHARPATT